MQAAGKPGAMGPKKPKPPSQWSAADQRYIDKLHRKEARYQRYRVAEREKFEAKQAKLKKPTTLKQAIANGHDPAGIKGSRSGGRGGRIAL